MLKTEHEQAAARIRADVNRARTPARWRRAHSLIDRAAAAIARNPREQQH